MQFLTLCRRLLLRNRGVCVPILGKTRLSVKRGPAALSLVGDIRYSSCAPINILIPNRKSFLSTTAAMDPSWKPPAPCRVGDDITNIYTPALLVDLDKLENNLKKMTKTMEPYGQISVRPHAKAHKCPPIAKLQVSHGAVGLCCQTLVEAEAMVYGGGCYNILLSNQLIGKPKLRRFVKLAKYAEIFICVDNSDNLKDISEVAQQMKQTVGCVVEVNVGQNRCGVEPGEAAVTLAREILSLPNVTFKGIQCYQGINQHVRLPADKQAAVDSVVEKTKATLSALKAAGIECNYVTGGGTGTYLYECASTVFTEVQPGSYVFMDVDYSRNKGADGKPFRDYEHSLLILTTVQSVTAGDRAVVDAGMKAVSLDSGAPLVLGNEEQQYICGGDEHGILKPDAGLKVGERVWLIPGHCDPTVNLYDWLVGVRGEKVEAVWPVLGRGPGV